MEKVETSRQLTLLIPETLKAWAAGFIDGEGSISIAKRIRRTYLQHIVRISVVNRNVESLKLLKELYGGHLFKHGTPPPDKNWADTYLWVLSDSLKVRIVLSDIEPYCIVKAAQIKIAKQFISTFVEPKGIRMERIGRCGKAALSHKVIDIREKLWGKMREVNRRGRK